HCCRDHRARLLHCTYDILRRWQGQETRRRLREQSLGQFIKSGEVIDRDRESRRNALDGLEAAIAQTCFNLREIGGANASPGGQILSCKAPMLAPRANLTFTVKDPVYDVSGDLLILARSNTAL